MAWLIGMVVTHRPWWIRAIAGMEEWQRLGKVGFFPPEYRAELVEGEIIDMSPIGELHSGGVDWLNHFFSGQLFGQMIVRVQNPLKLGDFSAPQPDITILRYQSH